MRFSHLTASRKHVPWGFLGMVLFVFVIERFLAQNHEVLATGQKIEWMLTSRAVRREAQRSKVLCFGDSLVKVGLAPRILENRLGMRSYNFALSGGQASASYFLLRRALRAGARPKAVLVDFKWTTLGDDPRTVAQLLSELGDPWDFLDLAWTMRDASLFASLTIAKFLPSALDRYSIRSAICARFKGEPVGAGSGNVGAWIRNFVVNRGGIHAPPNPWNGGQVDLANKHLIPDVWQPHPVAKAYLQRFVKLAQAHHVPVFWLIPPVTPALQSVREQNRTDDAFIEFVRSIQSEFPNLVVIDGRSACYPPRVFVDTTHLDRMGAVAFTDQVGSIVGRSLLTRTQAARWMPLPPYSERAAALALEDTEESARIIAAGSQHVRR